MQQQVWPPQPPMGMPPGPPVQQPPYYGYPPPPPRPPRQPVEIPTKALAIAAVVVLNFLGLGAAVSTANEGNNTAQSAVNQASQAAVSANRADLELDSVGAACQGAQIAAKKAEKAIEGPVQDNQGVTGNGH